MTDMDRLLMTTVKPASALFQDIGFSLTSVVFYSLTNWLNTVRKFAFTFKCLNTNTCGDFNCFIN